MENDQKFGKTEEKKRFRSGADIVSEDKWKGLEHHHRPEKFKLGILKKSMSSKIFNRKRTGRQQQSSVSFIY